MSKEEIDAFLQKNLILQIGTPDKKGDPIYKITEKKNTVYTWDGVNEKISKAVNN